MIRFMTVGFDVPAGSVAERDLQYLASITGGKYFAACDRRQLIRALQKHVRRFVPKVCKSSDPDLSAGVRALSSSDYRSAMQSFKRYASANPTDWCGFYNLALAYEANDRYKAASQSYQRYLGLAPNSPDRVNVQQQIAQLDQDYVDQYQYYLRLITSDRDYLVRYYDAVFNRSSSDLAQEFLGFVREKRSFYAELPEILEVRERWLVDYAKDISSSIDDLARRTRYRSFDSDAVSLLTTPIALLEELIGRLGQQHTSVRR
ncbi:MAG: tetratricopeptide repeat protein [Pyrinomonadaceae bacterium]